MKRIKNVLSAIAMSFSSLILLAAPVSAASTNTVVTPTSTIFDSNNVVAVPNDYAPGFMNGSFASDGTGKTDMYFTPNTLFEREITLGEIESISYWTKTGETHEVDPRDWYLTIYTNPYTGDVSTPTWYGDRIGAEPYFSENINDPADSWNQWSTDGTENTLRFFESTAGAPGATFGSYTDPTWDDFVTGNALSGLPYAGRTVQSFSIQTGSAWADGFTGQVDGLSITLTDGSVANVNFEDEQPEEPATPTNKDECKKDGWKSFGVFKNQGDCVSFVATNGRNLANNPTF